MRRPNLKYDILEAGSGWLVKQSLYTNTGLCRRFVLLKRETLLDQETPRPSRICSPKRHPRRLLPPVKDAVDVLNRESSRRSPPQPRPCSSSPILRGRRRIGTVQLSQSLHHSAFSVPRRRRVRILRQRLKIFMATKSTGVFPISAY